MLFFAPIFAPNFVLYPIGREAALHSFYADCAKAVAGSKNLPVAKSSRPGRIGGLAPVPVAAPRR